MSRILQFLGREILWGKMAGIAAGAALAALLMEQPPEMLSFLQGLSLFVFALAGMVVYRTARRHPFWNALVCAFFAALFYLLLYQMANLGETGALRPLAEIALWLPYMLILITVETFVGTGVFFLARQFADRARARQGEQKQETGAPAGREATRPKKEAARPGKAASPPSKAPARPAKKPPRRPPANR